MLQCHACHLRNARTFGPSRSPIQLSPLSVSCPRFNPYLIARAGADTSGQAPDCKNLETSEELATIATSTLGLTSGRW